MAAFRSCAAGAVKFEGRAGNVVIELESFDNAHAYASSPKYDDMRKHREQTGLIDIVVVEGC